MEKIKAFIYKKISKKFMDGCSSYNDLEVRKSCRSKEQARDGFAAHDIPHAKGLIFFNPWKAHQFAKQHGFPLVVKPNVSGYSRGSHFPITNFVELWKALIAVKIWWPTSVVEQYLQGKNYRVVVVKDDIMSAIERTPPYVTGDGEKNIAALIDEENRIREEMQLFPTIYPISKGQRTVNYLARSRMTLETVPQPDQQVMLYNKVALSPGGIVKTIDKTTIHPDNRALFLQTLNGFNANILGIDVIFEEGIETSYKDQKCIFLEVNSRPYLKMHDVPRYGGKEDLSPYYAKLDALDIKDQNIF